MARGRRRWAFVGALALVVAGLAAWVVGGGAAASATWTGVSVPAGTFPLRTSLDSLVIWKGHLVAEGNYITGCLDPTSDLPPCHPVVAIWTSNNGRAWTRHTTPVANAPGTDGQLLPDGKVLLLLRTAAGGAGDGNGSPPYEALSSVWRSSDGIRWTQQSIPAAMEQSGLGSAAAGNGTVVVPTYNLYSHQTGVWIENGSAHWAFHPSFDSQAGTFGLNLTAIQGGFVAGGEEFGAEPNTAPHPAVWSSSDGIRWTRTLLSTRPGVVDQIGSIGHYLVAVGSNPSAASPTNALAWASASGLWKSASIGPLTAPVILVNTSIGLVAVGSGATALYRTSNGNWSRIEVKGHGPTGTLNDLLPAYLNHQLVVLDQFSPSGAWIVQLGR